MRNQDLSRFLTSLFGEIDGYLYVPVKLEGGAWIRNFFKWPEQAGEIEEFILENQGSSDVYISPAIWKRDPGSDELTPEDWLGSQYLWTEFDGRLPTEFHGIPEPSIKVQSSGPEHQHWYWKLHYFETNVGNFETLNKKVTYNLQGDMSAWDYVQVLRPPCTKNHKPNKGQTAKLLECSSTPISLENIVGLEDPPKAAFLSEGDFKNVDLSDPITTIADNDWEPGIVGIISAKTTPRDRSKMLFAIACSMVRKKAKNNDILVILNFLAKKWNKFDGRRDRLKPLLGIIANARLAEQIFEETVQEEEEELLSYLRSALTVGKNLPPIEWIVEELLTDDGMSLITGKPGVGKTRVAMQLTMSLALGIPFLKYNISTPKKVLVISNEMNEREFVVFHDQMMKKYDEEQQQILDKNYIQFFKNDQFHLRTEEDFRRYKKLLYLVEPDIVVIDTLMATGGRPDDYAAMTFFFQALNALRNETGIANILNHHPKKETVGNPKTTKIDDVYGGRPVTQYATTVIGMWRKEYENPEERPEEETPTDFYCIKQKLDKDFRPIKITSTQYADFTVKSEFNDDDIEEIVENFHKKELPKQRKTGTGRKKREPDYPDEIASDLLDF